METTKTKPSVETLARDFAGVLKEWLKPEEMAEVVKRNKAETDSGVCHSHDFCDANMAMAEAFEKNGIEVDIQSDEQITLWNAAWDLAKANGFWFETLPHWSDMTAADRQAAWEAGQAKGGSL